MPTERDAPRCETCGGTGILYTSRETGRIVEGRAQVEGRVRDCPACAARPPVEGLREADELWGNETAEQVLERVADAHSALEDQYAALEARAESAAACVECGEDGDHPDHDGAVINDSTHEFRPNLWQAGFEAGANVIQDGLTADDWVGRIRAAEAERDALRAAMGALLPHARARHAELALRREMEAADRLARDIQRADRAARSGGEGAQGG